MGKENVLCSPTKRVKKSSISLDVPSTSRGIVPSRYCNQTMDVGKKRIVRKNQQASSQLHLEADVDDPDADEVVLDSDEEVVMIEVKRPKYQEITLDDDDDDDEIYVVSLNKSSMTGEEEKDIVEIVYSCPKCDKVFRMESFLKFHIKMHGALAPSTSITPDIQNMQSGSKRKEACNKRMFMKR